jgi:hypothetical protein
VRTLTDWTLREIKELFAGNGLIRRDAESLPEDRWPIGGSVRRAEAASYIEAVDLADPRQRVALLRVYSDVLSQMVDCPDKERLQRLLEEDGVEFSDTARIAPTFLKPPPGGSRLEAALDDFKLIEDPAVLREHAERIQRASLSADPPDAILAARELLETVCKLICEDFQIEIPKSPNLGELYKLAAAPLGLDAVEIEGQDDAAKASRKVLSGLVRVADGLGDLRTRIGRGHGRTRPSSARQRHAELATGAAAVLAIFLLDTWHERRKEQT